MQSSDFGCQLRTKGPNNAKFIRKTALYPSFLNTENTNSNGYIITGISMFFRNTAGLQSHPDWDLALHRHSLRSDALRFVPAIGSPVSSRTWVILLWPASQSLMCEIFSVGFVDVAFRALINQGLEYHIDRISNQFSVDVFCILHGTQTMARQRSLASTTSREPRARLPHLRYTTKFFMYVM